MVTQKCIFKIITKISKIVVIINYYFACILVSLLMVYYSVLINEVNYIFLHKKRIVHLEKYTLLLKIIT